MTDLTALTDVELLALANEVAAEHQKRSKKQELLDQAWNLVLDAKNSGYTKAATSNALTDVVTQAYK